MTSAAACWTGLASGVLRAFLSVPRSAITPWSARLSRRPRPVPNLESSMTRKKPAPRVVTERSRNNPHRRLCAAVPATDLRIDLSGQVRYGPYSKHKYHPTTYGLTPYAGLDVERTYCDAHSGFGLNDFGRIPVLLVRGVMLGLWSEQVKGGVPTLLWTIDDTGWIFELRITNAVQSQYHGYPVLQGDAFARQVLVRAREVAFEDDQLFMAQDPGVQPAIAAAEIFYR